MSSHLYTYFELEFRNTRTKRKKRVRFKIEKHNLAQRWAEMLQKVLESGLHLEKNYLLHSWQNNGRDIKYLCKILNKHVATINRYFAKKPKGLKYKIDQHFSPPEVSREDLNLIHHHFEILIGQSWKESKYFKAADPYVRYAIRQLNHLCHEIEHLQKHKDKSCDSNIFAAFLDSERKDLKPTDRKHFGLRLKFGDVKLHYAQLGKTYLEAFTDNDQEIFDSNISELRYLSGEFDVSLTDEIPLPVHKKVMAEFKTWLRNKGIDETKHNIGFVRVAKLDQKAFSGKSNRDILKELFKYDDISAIHLRKGRQTFFCEYPYHWKDPKYDKMQIHIPEKKKKEIVKKLKDKRVKDKRVKENKTEEKSSELSFMEALRKILKEEFPEDLVDAFS